MSSVCVNDTDSVLTIPGVAGNAGAEDSIKHGHGEVALVEEAVHPLVRENIG